MSDLRFCDVVLVAFPFTDQSTSKQRPAVVVSSRLYQRNCPDVVLMAVTSSLARSPHFGDVPVVEWNRAGLLRPSTIKPMLATVQRSLIRRRLGQLGTNDMVSLTKSLAVILG